MTSVVATLVLRYLCSMAAVIYLNGTATGYVWIRPGRYQSIISGDRAWCRVLEFAEEFGISVSYDPLVLAERRGG